MFVLLIWVVSAGGAWLVGVWMRHAHVVLNQVSVAMGAVTLVSALFLLQRYCIPHLAQVRLAGAGEQLGFPLSGAYAKTVKSGDAQV
jgi:hypothetical protein